MKIKFLLLISLIAFSLIPINPVLSQEEENVPDAPEFLGLVPNDEGNHFFDINETVTIRYSSDRFSVDGIVIVGNGSGLLLDPENENATQMERKSSLKGVSNWEVKINVTSYTYFYAFSWYNDISNRTQEEFDFLDDAPGHQLWLNVGPSYPKFSDVTNSTALDGSSARNENTEFYAERYTNVTVIYDVIESKKETKFVTLSFSNSSDGIYNETTSIRVNMTQTIFSDNARSRFIFEFNVTQRIIYFSAFSIYGWDRSLESVPTPVGRSVNTGFKFTVDFSEGINEYTTLDTVSFNMTSTNETIDDLFSYRYRYFENSTSKEPLLNWTDVSMDADLIDQYEMNNTVNNVNYTQSIAIYRAVLDISFNTSQVLHIQPYVTYFDETYNSTLRIIEFKDPLPEIQILSENNTQTASGSQLIKWDFNTVRGDITKADLTSNEKVITASLLNLENYTYFFTNDTDTIEGYHKITINATVTISVLNVSDFTRYEVEMWNVTNLVFQVDTTRPIGGFVNPPTASNSKGMISISFSFSDEGISPTGIGLVRLDWGDNTAINVTSLSSAQHQYRTGGSKTINMTIWDKVGNYRSYDIQIDVTVPTTAKSNENNSPITTIAIITSITFLVLILRISKNSRY